MIGFFFYEQAIAVVFLALIASNITFLVELRKVKNWSKYLDVENLNEEQKKECERIKRNCYRIPGRLYVFHAFVPVLATVVGLTLTRG